MKRCRPCVMEEIPEGLPSPLEVLVQADSQEELDAAVDEVVAQTREVDGVSAAVAPDNEVWRTDDSAVVVVIPTDELVNSENAAVATRVTEANSDVAGYVGVTGTGAFVLDYIDAVYGSFPLVLLLISACDVLAVCPGFPVDSVAAKAVLLNIASVAATFGVVVWFWQEGNGSEAIFGISATGLSHVLASCPDFRFPLRAFDGLRGLHSVPDARGVRRVTGSTKLAVILRPWEDRPTCHRRCSHPLLCLPRPCVVPRYRHQGFRYRIGLWHLAGCHDRPRIDGAGAGFVARALELVPTGLGGEGAFCAASCGRHRTARLESAGIRCPDRRGPQAADPGKRRNLGRRTDARKASATAPRRARCRASKACQAPHRRRRRPSDGSRRDASLRWLPLRSSRGRRRLRLR